MGRGRAVHVLFAAVPPDIAGHASRSYRPAHGRRPAIDRGLPNWLCVGSFIEEGSGPGVQSPCLGERRAPAASRAGARTVRDILPWLDRYLQVD